MSQITKITLDVKEVAQLIGVSSNSIYTMVAQKQIPHVRVRSRVLFHRDVIESWVRGEQQKA